MLRAEFIILMRRLQSGDIGALAPLYEEYFQKMYSTVLVMLHSAEDAYDVATAAILKLADYRGDPAKIKNPVGYLIAMSANEAKNFLRRRKREVSSDISELPAGYGMEMPSEMLWLDDLMRLFTQHFCGAVRNPQSDCRLFELNPPYDVQQKYICLNERFAKRFLHMNYPIIRTSN